MSESGQNNDVMDLMDSFKSILKGIFNSVRFLILFSFDKIIVLSIFIVLGISFGCIFYYTQVPTYTSIITVSHSSGKYDNYYCTELINGLDLSIDKKSNIELGRKLGIKDAQFIKKIQFSPLEKGFSKKYKDSLLNEIPFRIEFEVSDRIFVEKNAHKVIDYLNNNSFVRMKKSMELQTLRKRIESIDERLLELNTLKDLVDKNVTPPTSSGTGLIWGSPINPIVVYQTIISLNKEKLETIERTKIDKSFYLVLVSTNSISSKISLMKIVVFSVIISYIVSLVSMFIYLNLKSR